MLPPLVAVAGGGKPGRAVPLLCLFDPFGFFEVLLEVFGLPLGLRDLVAHLLLVNSFLVSETFAKMDPLEPVDKVKVCIDVCI